MPTEWKGIQLIQSTPDNPFRAGDQLYTRTLNGLEPPVHIVFDGLLSYMAVTSLEGYTKPVELTAEEGLEVEILFNAVVQGE